LGLIGFELGLNWLCFWAKSSFLAQNRGKLGLFCIKRFFCARVLAERVAGRWLLVAGRWSLVDRGS